MRQTLIIILGVLIFFGFSCSDNKQHIGKLIIAQIGNMPTYDSLGKPQLSLRMYYELDKKILKIAKGNFEYVFSENAPPFSLDKFYKFDLSDSQRQLIEEKIFSKAFDSIYIKSKSGDSRWFVMIYQTSNKTRQIIYEPSQLPKDLFFVDSLLRSQIKSESLIETNSFNVDKLFENFEKQLFLIHPPPPPPSKIDTI